MNSFKAVVLICCIFLSGVSANAQMLDKVQLSGMYIQWGYNREWYTNSSIRFKNGAEYDFRLHNVVAKDKPDFQAIIDVPFQISIPQYNYRIGFYLNAERTKGIELNFDHTKYVVQDYQQVRLTGFIGNKNYDEDITLDPQQFHFEHTDGANFLHLNYFSEMPVLMTRKKTRSLLSVIGKAGAGIVIPRTDVTFQGKRLNNRFHIAGYIASVEAGLRYYPLKTIFLESTLKGGFANYLNALTMEGGMARHHFFYGEVTCTLGYSIPFGKNKSASHKMPE